MFLRFPGWYTRHVLSLRHTSLDGCGVYTVWFPRWFTQHVLSLRYTSLDGCGVYSVWYVKHSLYFFISSLTCSPVTRLRVLLMKAMKSLLNLLHEWFSSCFPETTKNRALVHTQLSSSLNLTEPLLLVFLVSPLLHCLDWQCYLAAGSICVL